MGKIYFVDEDVGQIGAWADILAIMGHETKIFRDADEAFRALWNCADADLVFIDVMLADAEEVGQRRYSRNETDDYQTTGLRLLDDLSQQNSALFPVRAVLLSQVVKPGILDRIQARCKAMGVLFWKKADFSEPFEFARRTEERLKELGVESRATT